MAELEENMNLQPIKTAPKDGRYILLFGPSGCTTTQFRCHVGRWDPDFHPFHPWQTYADDAFEDDGAPATHWCPIPDVVSAPAPTPIKTATIAYNPGPCYYCPECGHKYWNLPTGTGKFEPANWACVSCSGETLN